MEEKNDYKEVTDTYLLISNTHYDQALRHCIDVISRHYIAGHSVVTPVLDSIIKEIKELKHD